MFKINRKLEYALIALKHMSEKIPGELTSAKEISDAHHAPFDATARVLQIMAQKGVLKSEHGPHGGYQIQTDLARITFLQLSEMILGPVKLVECLHDENETACELVSTCNIMSPIVQLNDKLKEFYSTITVRDLVAPLRRGQRGAAVAAGEFVV
jgi:Rrf2 family protein